MANRPVFIVSNEPPFYKKVTVEFTYFNGFSSAQKKKCIDSLHSSFLNEHQNMKTLEISSKSPLEFGVKLSAFNLCTKDGYTVESAFQGSKVFERSGPFTDILARSSKEAKRDTRLTFPGFGKIIGFNFLGEIFGNEPKTYFYNWLYINAVHTNPDLIKQIIEFDAFTDIEFNPQKSINCQAQAAAIYVSLCKNHLLNEALKSKESFLKIVYSMGEDNTQCVAKFENYKLHNPKYKNNVYLLGYDISEADTDILTLFKQENKENIYKFLSKPINLLEGYIPLNEIDCIIYPISSPSNLIQRMIEELTNYEAKAKWTESQEVKKLPQEMKFDLDKFSAHFSANNSSKKQYDKEYQEKIENINKLAQKIKDCGYFSVANEVPKEYRKFISNFLYFNDKELTQTFENIKAKRILIIDDILSKGVETELIEIITTLNSNCEIFVFTSIVRNPQL